jgi:hypothetical protein
MSQLLAFLLIGLLFIFLLLLWALRTNRSPSHSGGDSEISLEEFWRPSLMLVDRIFSSQDWDFVRKEATHEVQKEFLRERKSVALLWLKQTRRDAESLMKFHRRTIRRNIELKPSLEIRLAVDYLAFLFLCTVLQMLIRARGPFRTRRMAGHAFGAAKELWSLSAQLVFGLDPSRHEKINAVWTNKQT